MDDKKIIQCITAEWIKRDHTDIAASAAIDFFHMFKVFLAKITVTAIGLNSLKLCTKHC